MRYALFAGDFYYPAGGWSDLHSRWERAEEAIGEADKLLVMTYVEMASGYGYHRSDKDWAQVVDLESGSIVYSAVKEER